MIEELTLIEKCKDWQLENFSILYDKYFQKIYNFIYLKVYSREEAEDLTSETFFKALDKIHTFKSDSSASFQAWIYRIAHNKVVDHYRTKKESTSIEEVIDFKASWENIPDELFNKMKLEEVVKFMDWLKKEHKDVVVMRIWDNLSYKEIAEVTGLSESNCKKIVSRNLAKINESIVFTLLLLIIV